MKPELKERLARLERTPGVIRVLSGSPVDLLLRWTDPKSIWSISAMESLVRRHVSRNPGRFELDATSPDVANHLFKRNEICCRSLKVYFCDDFAIN